MHDGEKVVFYCLNGFMEMKKGNSKFLALWRGYKSADVRFIDLVTQSEKQTMGVGW